MVVSKLGEITFYLHVSMLIDSYRSKGMYHVKCLFFVNNSTLFRKKSLLFRLEIGSYQVKTLRVNR